MIGWIVGTRLGRSLALAGAVAAALAAWTLYQRHDAAEDAVNQIKEINNALSEQAISARDARRSCVDAGGMWDFAAGRCAQDDP